MTLAKMWWIRTPHVAAVFFVLLISGCAGPPKVPATVSEPNASAPGIAPPAVATAPASTNPSPLAAATPTIVTTVETKSSPSPTPAATAAPAAKPATVPVKAATAPATAQVTKATPAPVTKSAAAPLDVKSLETRLKQTEAIGVFTKIALKNQVNDLLDQFRAYYGGRLKITLAELRRPYEMLLQKVLALLQDADAALASAIVASREAIWGILADPAKFATI